MKFYTALLSLAYVSTLMAGANAEVTNVTNSDQADFVFIIGKAASGGSYRESLLATTNRYIKQLGDSKKDYRYSVVSYGGDHLYTNLGFTTNTTLATSVVGSIEFDSNTGRDALEALMLVSENKSNESKQCQESGTCDITFRNNVDKYVMIIAPGDSGEPTYGYTNDGFKKDDAKTCSNYKKVDDKWNCTSTDDSLTFTNGEIYKSGDSYGYFRNSASPAKLTDAYTTELSDTVKAIEDKGLLVSIVYRSTSWNSTLSTLRSSFDWTNPFFRDKYKDYNSSALLDHSTTAQFGPPLLNVQKDFKSQLGSSCTAHRLKQMNFTQSLYYQVLEKKIPMYVIDINSYINSEDYFLFSNTFVDDMDACPNATIVASRGKDGAIAVSTNIVSSSSEGNGMVTVTTGVVQTLTSTVLATTTDCDTTATPSSTKTGSSTGATPTRSSTSSSPNVTDTSGSMSVKTTAALGTLFSLFSSALLLL